MPFALVAALNVIVLLPLGRKPTSQQECEWSNLFGGWRLTSGGLAHFWHTPCKRHRFSLSDSDGKPGHSRPLLKVNAAKKQSVCVIGDSSQRDNWELISLAAPAQFAPVNLEVRTNGAFYLDAINHSYAQSAISRDQDAWEQCLHHNSNTSVVVFHVSNFEYGASSSEGRLSVRSLIKSFDGWIDASSRRCCAVLVSLPDVLHEAIDDNTGYLGQAQFRNSFRINSINGAMKDELLTRRGHRNIHFLDQFHMSLGLHWSGHFMARRGSAPSHTALHTRGERIDPLHFHPEHLNIEFARLVWEGTQALCGK